MWELREAQRRHICRQENPTQAIAEDCQQSTNKGATKGGEGCRTDFKVRHENMKSLRTSALEGKKNKLMEWTQA